MPKFQNYESRPLSRPLHPEKLYDLSPRKFEELIANILRDFGCDVELTQATRDGGKDIIAYFRTAIGRFLTYVECKKYRPPKKVGIEVVQKVYGVHNLHNAHKSIIVTTTSFTEPAITEARAAENKIELKNYDDIKAWLRRYLPDDTVGNNDLDPRF